jgi:4-amino-4-deoxy-L-arabinose transferase-like glycosyltransferase
MMNFIRSHKWLIAILLTACLFRFWQINTLPAGLFPDEAANGLDVNSILSGDLKPFYERGNGREALFFYFLAAAVGLFGRGPFQHHMVSAGFGFAEVLVTYFLARRLFNKRIALLASFFMAVSSYAVTLSRTAFRANTVPLFTTLTILFLVKFFQSDQPKTKMWSAIAAGVSFGLGFYTYISYRMMIPLLLGVGLLIIFAYRDRFREIIQAYWRYKLAFVSAFLVVFAPLGHYFISHPGSFIGRAGHVSIFSPDLNQGNVLGTLFEVFKLTMLGFFTEGDLNWRHNVAGFPFLSPFLSPFFALALVAFTWACFKLLKQVWQKNLNWDTFVKALVAIWFWFMLAPEVTTAEGIPHGLRLIGVIPPMFILAAWGVNWAWEHFLAQVLPKRAALLTVFVFISGIFMYNFYLYFGIAASSPDYYYAFRSDLTLVSGYINKRNQKEKTYLSLDKFSVQTVDYLTTETGRPFVLLDPAATFEVSLRRGDHVIFTQSTMFDRLKFKQTHPSAQLIVETINKFGQPVMLVYQQP